MSDTRLNDLIWQYRQRRRQGEEVTPEDMCGGCPELLGPFLEQLARLDSLDSLAESLPLDTTSRGAAPAAVPPQRLGPFLLLDLLGKGGMGLVYRALDPQLGREVALKVMKPSLACHLEMRARFLREARAAAAIQHDHVVPIYQVGEDGGVPYIAMPVLAGESLAKRLEREPVLTAAEVARIGRETAEGLAAAHEKGLVHRDVKPGNLWLEAPSGRVKILDFGLARAAEGGVERDQLPETLTQEGVVLGSPGYMSPEQANGERPGVRSDLFSLGCVLYRLATGTMAFAGPNLMAVLRATAEHQPPAARAVNPQVPEWLSALVGRLLAKRPEERPESAREVADELRNGAPSRRTTGRRAGAPSQWPPLPTHHVRRPREEDRLVADLLREDSNRGVVVSALFGMGGIGKSTLAAAAAQRPEVLERFPDGVLWATLGQNPELASLLSGWVRDLGDHEFRGADARAASARLRQLLNERAALLVVDDAWNSEHVEHFRVGGRHCRLLVTTRRVTIADDLGALRHELPVLDAEQALELLASRLQRPLGDGELGPAREVVEELGRLPLALELAAVRVGRGVPWEELLRALQREVAAFEALENPAKRRQGKARLDASFHLSLRALRTEDEAAWRCFVWLGVLPDDATLAAPMASALWGVADPEEADGVLEYLWGEALLQPAAGVRVCGRQWRAYRVHDLMHDCARRLLSAPDSPSREGEVPGLGLSWEEAQSQLLERYRGRTRAGQWHTLLDDGYVHRRLSWHLERAGRAEELHSLLREETAEGRNGWYEANERIGQPATFAEDVAQAWRLADDGFRRGRQQSLGLQCRYALVTASLNSMAVNLPRGLLESLVREGSWPVEQALTYARQNPSPARKAGALCALIPFVTPDERFRVAAESLAAVRAIGHEGGRARALARLAPHLSPDLLAEALTVARAIGHEWGRARALGGLASHLGPGLREVVLVEALETARAIGPASSRSAQPAAGAREEALEIDRPIGYTWGRAMALMELAPQMPPELRATALAEALEAARAVEDERGRATALAGLASLLPQDRREEVLAEALTAARAVAEKGSRERALLDLAAHLPPDLLAEVLAGARAIADGGARASALTKLAPHLPRELRDAALSEALAAVRAVAEDGPRATALTELAPHLPEDQRGEVLAEALAAARAVADVGDRPTALAGLVPHLSGGLRRLALAEGLAAARAIPDEGGCALALAGLAPYLPDEARGPAVAAALADARAISHAGVRPRALAGLAPHLPVDLRGKVFVEALAAARAIGHEWVRAIALAELAPRLPDELRGEAIAEGLAAVGALVDRGYRGVTLARLALAGLAPYLGESRREEVLAEALASARASKNEGFRAMALAELAPLLPQGTAAEALGEALAAARATEEKGDRALALARLVPHLSQDLLEEALGAVRAVADDGRRAVAMAKLAPHLSQGLLGQALRDASAIRYEGDRAAALTDLAPHLARLPRPEVASLWSETLHELARWPRQFLMADLRALTPFLTDLAGPNAPAELRELAMAILDVVRWWN